MQSVQRSATPRGRSPRSAFERRAKRDMNDSNKPRPGDMVVLTAVPAGPLDGLPEEDQHAITAMVGKPVLLVGYDDDGRAEIGFDDPFDVRTDTYSNTHSVWVPPAFLTRFPENQK